MTSTGYETMQKTCSEHGFYQAKFCTVMGKTLFSKCPKCEENEKSDDDNKKTQKEQFEKQRKQHIFLHRSGIPLRFRGKTFDDYVPTNPGAERAQKICKAYASRFSDRFNAGGGLVLFGRPGTGKSHLACAIANQVIMDGYQAAFMDVLEAVRLVKSTYRKDSAMTEGQAIHELSEPDLLILDEIGVQFGTPAEMLILFEIINRRYNNVKPTILLSNLNLEDLKTLIGERIIDRMREGGGAVIPFDWESDRK